MPQSSIELPRPELEVVMRELWYEDVHSEYIGDKIMPVFPVNNISADYPYIPREEFLKIPDDISRAPHGSYARRDWEVKWDSYRCSEVGFESVLDDKLSAIYGEHNIEADIIGAEQATHIVKADYERKVANTVMKEANAIATITAAKNWLDPTANAKKDIYEARLKMRSLSLLRSNTIVIPEKYFEFIDQHIEIKASVHYTDPLELKDKNNLVALLTKYFNIKNIYIGYGAFDTKPRGKTSEFKSAWDHDYIALMYLDNKTKNLQVPNFGRTFAWTGDVSRDTAGPSVFNGPPPLKIETYREPSVRSEIYRCRTDIDVKVTSPGCSVLIKMPAMPALT